MTLQQLLKNGELTLSKHGVPDADLDAWLLLSHLLNMDRGRFFLERNREATEAEINQYDDLIACRAQRIPLQHITGTACFMGLDMTVNEHVLVPRQDTEKLVELVITAQRQKKLPSGGKLLDMCTGSGCIAIACGTLGDFSVVDAVDLSDEALKVAQENAAANRCPVHFLKSNLFENVPACRYDVIVSNPPYIPTADIADLTPEVRDHDPMMALDGMADGLYFYRQLAAACPDYLTDEGMIFWEIGYDQGEALKTILTEQGYRNVTIEKDDSGQDRVVVARCPLSPNIS
ncbi:MAG: peptide chain release factor N(5)-glutamine methyltransferase [Lachnospiraceae bacterium]|nr:peptide chain release factor N(5)-glutamine methyltransferase [Lachnospiraceae bacterium]